MCVTVITITIITISASPLQFLVKVVAAAVVVRITTTAAAAAAAANTRGRPARLSDWGLQ